MSPRLLAAELDHVDCVVALIEHMDAAASQSPAGSTVSPKHTLDDATAYWARAVVKAAGKGSIATLRWLLQHSGAAARWPHDRCPAQAALVMAAESQHLECDN